MLARWNTPQRHRGGRERTPHSAAPGAAPTIGYAPAQRVCAGHWHNAPMPHCFPVPEARRPYRVFVVLACAVALLLGACDSLRPRAQVTGAARPTPLILISIDGFRADYIERGITPTLARLAADGVHAKALRPSFPTLTFPNHYTLVTGLYPDHHGIVHNRMENPRTGERYVYNDARTTADPAWWGGEPIWVDAEKHGLRTATMFWPGSDVAIAGVRPQRWMHFDKHVSAGDRVATLLSWFDQPENDRPDFITLYFDQVDRAGHDYGPDSPEINAALSEIDAAIGELIAGLAARGRADAVNVVIVSDHGLTSTSPDRVQFLEDIIDVHDVDMVTGGVVAGFRPDPGRRRRVEEALLAPHEHMQCWRREQLPARFHYGTHPRIPPLLCLAEPGWILSTRDYEQHRDRRPRGEHGYDNALPEMRALFIANGPAFKHGLVVPEFDNIHVYALLAHLLHVPAAANDGKFEVTAPMLIEQKAP